MELKINQPGNTKPVTELSPEDLIAAKPKAEEKDETGKETKDTSATQADSVVGDTPEVKPEPSRLAPAHPTDEKGFSVNERVPSDWEILPHGDNIHATNIKTGRVFVGTTREFSKALKA